MMKLEMVEKWRLHRDKMNKANAIMMDMIQGKKKTVNGGILHYIKEEE